MPPTRYPCVAPDLDALELTLVRSIENIRETLPQNRRQSEDLSTIAFSLDQNKDGSGTVSPSGAEKTLVRRGLVVSTENFGRAKDVRYGNSRSLADGEVAVEERFPSTDSSWKKHIRESEALALENQMESIRQDMRDLAEAKQRRDQALSGRRDPNQRKLRRVSEALPQKRASNSTLNSNSEQYKRTSLVGFLNWDSVASYESQIQTPKGLEMGKDPVGSGSMMKYNLPKRTSSKPKLPLAQKTSTGSPPVLPIDSKIYDQRSRRRLSEPTARSWSFSPSGILPPTTPTLPTTLNSEITTPSQYKKVDLDQRPHHQNTARENAADPDGGRQTQYDPMGSKSGKRPQIPGGKKVRFAGKLVSIEKSTPEERYGRKSAVAQNPSISSLSSLSSSSLSTATSTSLDEDLETSESESQPSSSDDEELGGTAAPKPARTPLSSLSQACKGNPWEITLPPRKPRKKTATRGVKEKEQGEQSEPPDTLPEKGETAMAKKTYSLDDSPQETSEQRYSPGRSSGLTGHGFESPIQATSATNPQQPSLNKNTNSSIRALLRKHSGNLLNKFSWRGNKAGGLTETSQEVKEESKCVRCREVFDAGSLIQVSEKCLHSCCRSCLKAMFARALKDPHNGCPVKCCGSNLIDVSLATDLLSRKKIARYEQLLVKSSALAR